MKGRRGSKKLLSESLKNKSGKREMKKRRKKILYPIPPFKGFATMLPMIFKI